MTAPLHHLHAGHRRGVTVAMALACQLVAVAAAGAAQQPAQPLHTERLAAARPAPWLSSVSVVNPHVTAGAMLRIRLRVRTGRLAPGSVWRPRVLLTPRRTSAPLAARLIGAPLRLAHRRALAARLHLRIPMELHGRYFVRVCITGRAHGRRLGSRCRRAGRMIDVAPRPSHVTPPPLPPAAGPPDPVTTQPTSPVPLPGSLSPAADAVVDAPDASSAVRAAAELLRRAGVAIAATPAEAASSSAGAPATGIVLLSAELVAAAHDGQARATQYRLTLADFVAALSGAGAPVPAATDAFERLLAQWVQIARSEPNSDAAVAPLALAELARRQDPPVDISTPGYPASQLHLGALDFWLLEGQIARMAAGYRGDLVAPDSGAPRSIRRDDEPPTPCTAVKELLDDRLVQFAGDAFGYGAGKLVQQALERYVAALNDYLDVEDGVEKFGQLLNVVSLLTKVQAVVQLYRHVDASLAVVGPAGVEQPYDGDEAVFKTLRVDAGVAESDWDDYLAARNTSWQAFQDCAAALGLPTVADTGGVGQAVDKWKARFEILDGDQVTYDLTSFDTSLLTNTLRRIDDHRGFTEARFEIRHQGPRPSGPVVKVTTPVHILAELSFDAPPEAATWLGVLDTSVFGDPFGVILSSADVLAEWFKGLDTLKRTATLQVVHDQPSHAVLVYRAHVTHDHVNHGLGSSEQHETWTMTSTVPVADPVEGRPAHGQAAITLDSAAGQSVTDSLLNYCHSHVESSDSLLSPTADHGAPALIVDSMSGDPTTGKFLADVRIHEPWFNRHTHTVQSSTNPAAGYPCDALDYATDLADQGWTLHNYLTIAHLREEMLTDQTKPDPVLPISDWTPNPDYKPAEGGLVAQKVLDDTDANASDSDDYRDHVEEIFQLIVSPVRPSSGS